MTENKRLRDALDQIARNRIPDQTNLWPGISSALEQNNPCLPVRRRLSVSFVTVVIALVIISSAAYAFYRIMIDPGLQSADDAGLIQNISQTAEPTAFATLPAEFAPESNSEQTQNGVTVKLNWAYADENRLAINLLVSGLKFPENVKYRDLICNPVIRTEEKVYITHVGYSQAKILEDQPGHPLELTYIAYQPIDASKYPDLNLHLDLTIGACNPYGGFAETNVKKPTPFPLIGNYALNFKVPVQKGLVLSPAKEVERNSLRIRLETVTLSRSYTSVRLCYSPSTLPGAVARDPGAGLMMLDLETTIQMDGRDVVALPQLSAVEVNKKEGCIVTGAPIPNLDQPAKITVKVLRVVSMPSAWDFLDPAEQKVAVDALKKEGIEIEFTVENNHYWKIISKPANMTDEEVNSRVYEVMTKSIEGPWVFEIKR